MSGCILEMPFGFEFIAFSMSHEFSYIWICVSILISHGHSWRFTCASCLFTCVSLFNCWVCAILTGETLSFTLFILSLSLLTLFCSVTVRPGHRRAKALLLPILRIDVGNGKFGNDIGTGIGVDIGTGIDTGIGTGTGIKVLLALLSNFLRWLLLFEDITRLQEGKRISFCIALTKIPGSLIGYLSLVLHLSLSFQASYTFP